MNRPSAVLSLLFGVACLSCADTGASGVDDGESLARVEMSLTIGDAEIERVEFVIEGPALQDRENVSGLFEVVEGRDPPVWARVEELPVGTGYTISLIARGPLGRIVCEGSAPFNIRANEVTKVELELRCGRPVGEATGTLEIDARFVFVDGTCGDGVIDLDSGEQCDDGNAYSGDGCNAECIFEFVCETVELRCTSTGDALPDRGTAVLTILPEGALVAGATRALTLVVDDVVLAGFEPGSELTLFGVTTRVRTRVGADEQADIVRTAEAATATPDMNWFAFGFSGQTDVVWELSGDSPLLVVEIVELLADVGVNGERGQLECIAIDGDVRIPIVD